MQHYVVGFMYSPDRRSVALIEKGKPDWQRGKLNGIGGKIERGETPTDAMAREFKEETGVETSAEQWKHFCIIEKPMIYEIHFFSTLSKELKNARTIEEEEVGIYAVGDLPANTLPNLRWLIPMSLDPRLAFETPVIVTEKG
ncbi:NUDIX hydrolase [Nitratifractor sp.]